MKTRKLAIEVIRKLCEKHKGIKLSLGEKGSASWKEDDEELNNETWKHIGYVSALSWAFDITQKDLN